MNNIQPKIAGFIGVLIGLYIIISVVSTEGNVVGDFFLYLSIGGFVIGVLRPKLGLILLSVAGFYLDLMKRFLIVAGQVDMMDMIKVLSFCPIVFLGIMIRHLLMMSQQGFKVPKTEIIAMLASIAFSAAILAIKFFQVGFNGLTEGANNAAYIGFIWIACYYLRDRVEINKFFNFALVAFVPVVIYAYWQLIFGYSELEYDYALSGLSIVTTPLELGEISYYRIFATMSSSSAYGLTAVVLACYCLVLNPGKTVLAKLTVAFFGILCLASLIPGAGRSGWAMAIIILTGSFIFRSKLGTLLVYSFTVACLMVLFLAGDKLIEAGDGVMQANSSDTEWGRRASTVGTFTDRTESIKNWTTNPECFSWFGIAKDQQEGLFIHDMLGEVYVSYGVVLFIFVIILMVSGLVYAHKGVLGFRDRKMKNQAAYLLASIFGLLILGIVSGGGLRIFPVNFYFWAMVGGLLMILRSNNAARKQTQSSI